MKWHILSITCFSLAVALHAVETPDLITPIAIDTIVVEVQEDPIMLPPIDTTLLPTDYSVDSNSIDCLYTTIQSAEQLKNQFVYDMPYFEELSLLQSEIDVLNYEDIDLLIKSNPLNSNQDLQSFITAFQTSLQLNVMQNIDKIFAFIDDEPQLTLCQVLRTVLESNTSTPDLLANSLFINNFEWDFLFLIDRCALAKHSLNRQNFDQQFISEHTFYKTNLLILLEKLASFQNLQEAIPVHIHKQLIGFVQVAVDEAAYQYDLSLLKDYIAGDILPETDTEQQIINCIVALSTL